MAWDKAALSFPHWLLCSALHARPFPAGGPRKPPPYRATCGQWLGPRRWRSLSSKEDIRERDLVPESPGMQLLKTGQHCESLGGPAGDPYSGEPGTGRVRKPGESWT